MDRAAPDQPDRPYRGRRGGANKRVQVFYNAQDLAFGAIRRLVRIQGQTPNFIIPRRQYDQNDPYVALIVNVDWYGVQSLLADEVTRLAPYIPGLDAQVQAARQAAAQGAADGAPEPEQELNPADPAVRPTEDRQQQDLDDYTDVEVDYTDVEVEPEEFPPEGAASAATVSPPPGLEQPEQTQEGQEAQQHQVEAEAAAGDAVPAEAEPEEEEEEIVANIVLAPKGAASGAPEELVTPQKSSYRPKTTNRVSTRCKYLLLSPRSPKVTEQQ